MVIVGLGNPGAEYASTRHNAGFMVVDAVAAALGVRLAKVWLRPYSFGARQCRDHRDYLVKPLTFMNRSGDVLPQVLRRARSGPDELLVVYDNVDLAPGVCRLRLRGATGGGHHGIESILRALGTGDFMRLSVGIGRPTDGGDLAEHVLSAPGAPEAALVRHGIERAARAVLELLDGEPSRVMNELNTRDGGAP